jgi:peptidoglycan biosynthesis protein MviN/MurJ (putative lipid II flippase)
MGPIPLFGKGEKMPISILLALIVGTSVAMYFYLRPLQVFSNKQWLISHGFMLVGLGLMLGWLWFNRDQFDEGVTMLMGGIWTSLCFAMIYAVRRRGKG